MNKTWSLSLLVALWIWTGCGAPANAMLAPDPHRLGVEAYQQGEYEKALAHFEEATRQDPRSHLSHYWMAVTLVQLDRMGDALPHYRQVIRLAPESKAGRLAKHAVRQIKAARGPVRKPVWTVTSRGAQTSGTDTEGMVNVNFSPKAEAGGDYLGVEGPIRRWPKMPLKIYIESHPDGRRIAAAKKAINAWVDASGGLFRYQEVSSRDSADIQLLWVPHLSADSQLSGATAQHRAGQTQWHEVKSIIKFAKILLPLNETRTQKPLSPEETYTALLHEMGHALGLDHSPDPYDVMYYSLSPFNQTGQLTKRDRNSVIKLYQPAIAGN